MAYVRQLGSYTWRIKEWSSKAYEDVLNSRVFAVGDTRWNLRMYPQGVDETASGYLSVLLVREAPLEVPFSASFRPPSEKLVDCSFSLILRAAQGATDRRTELTKHPLSTRNTGRGYAKFLELAALNDASRGFITDDTLTIVAELSVGVVPTGVARAPIAHEGYADTLFVEPPAAANQCGICLCVMKDPVGGCRHGHNFCRGCLTTWLSNGCKNCPTCRSSVHNVVPNRYAADAIGALAVRCPATVDQLWHLVRCAWTGPLHELAAHRSSCVAEEVPCFWALCKKRMLRGIADSHAARCEHRSVFCPKCSHVLNGADAISTHGARCLAEPARCSNAGCDALVLRAAMPAHRAVCTFEVVPCAVPGCRASVTRNGINAHMASAAAAHMQALCGQVVALTARLEDAERELRRISAEQGASKRPRH